MSRGLFIQLLAPVEDVPAFVAVAGPLGGRQLWTATEARREAKRLMEAADLLDQAQRGEAEEALQPSLFGGAA